MDSEKLCIARDKLTRVFRYLEALNQHRNPAKRQIREQPWSLSLHGLPNHPTIKRGTAKASASKSKAAKENHPGENDLAGEFLLKVQRPVLTRPPEPPEEIASWLESGWDNPSEELAVRDFQSESEKAGDSHVARFDEDNARVAALQRWKVLRDEWAKTERPARAAMEAFRNKSGRPADPLTARERQVLQLIAEGKSTKDTATVLGISVKTAESHRMRLMQKLDIHETASLVRYAVRRGLIQP
jgi:DNA-binding CsgD family transcriptional regulator